MYIKNYAIRLKKCSFNPHNKKLSKKIKLIFLKKEKVIVSTFNLQKIYFTLFPGRETKEIFQLCLPN